jgi:hypothetical protein
MSDTGTPPDLWTPTPSAPASPGPPQVTAPAPGGSRPSTLVVDLVVAVAALTAALLFTLSELQSVNDRADQL